MRAVLKLLVLLAVVVAAAWGALWWYAESRLEAGVQTWLAQTQASGDEQVTYDALNRGTSPLAATVTLINPRLSVQTPGAATPVTVTLPSVTLRIDALDPQTLHMDVVAPVSINTPNGQAGLTFTSLTIANHIDSQALFDPSRWPFRGPFSFSASNLAVTAASGSVQVVTLGSLTEQGTLDLTAGAGADLYDVTLQMQNLALSPLLTKLGNVPFGGQIGELGMTASLTGPLPADWQQRGDTFRATPAGPARDKLAIQFLHDWAAAGGSGKLGLTLNVGPSALTASGNVGFDANVQPSGAADVNATHLDALSAAITTAYPQVADTITAVQAQLTPYLSTSAADGQVLKLHVDYGKPGVVVNGQNLTSMPPLDWDALENPPPPPAQAPGDGSGADSSAPAPATAPAQ
jgi:hypothetical protein